MKKNIKIAIQKKGRLSEESKKFLISLGLDFPVDSKSLSLSCSNNTVNIIQVRDDDIPKYVENSSVDFGIVGLDVLRESGAKARIIKKLDFCRCKLVIAAPRNSNIRSLKDLTNKKIATSYPNILKNYLKNIKVEAEIVHVMGSVEVAPYLEAADAVCDITETGRTLKEFSLAPIKTILKSQAVLISSPAKKSAKIEFLARLKI